MAEIGNFLCGSRGDKITNCTTAPAGKNASSDPPNALAAGAGEATEKLTPPAATTFFARLRKRSASKSQASYQDTRLLTSVFSRCLTLAMTMLASAGKYSHTFQLWRRRYKGKAPG